MKKKKREKELEADRMRNSFILRGCEVVSVSHFGIGFTMHVLYPDNHIEDYFFDGDGEPSHDVKECFDFKHGQEQIQFYHEAVRNQKQDKLEKYDTEVAESLKRLIDSGQIVMGNGEFQIRINGYGSIQPPSGDGSELAEPPAETSSTLPPFIQRMEEEHKELEKKIAKLSKFMFCNYHDDSNFSLLRDQSDSMKRYLETLARRIQKDTLRHNGGGDV